MFSFIRGSLIPVNTWTWLMVLEDISPLLQKASSVLKWLQQSWRTALNTFRNWESQKWLSQFLLFPSNAFLKLHLFAKVYFKPFFIQTIITG